MTTSQRKTVRGTLPVDDSAFAVLADERRRIVLRCLRSTDEPVAVADLARDVAATERDVDAREVPEDAVQRVYVALYRIHHPKLADEGYLRYDDDRSAVALADEAESLVPYLELVARRTE